MIFGWGFPLGVAQGYVVYGRWPIVVWVRYEGRGVGTGWVWKCQRGRRPVRVLSAAVGVFVVRLWVSGRAVDGLRR